MWFKWLLIIMYVVIALGNIAMIEEERKPISRGGAMMGVIINSLLIWGVIHYF